MVCLLRILCQLESFKRSSALRKKGLYVSEGLKCYPIESKKSHEIEEEEDVVRTRVSRRAASWMLCSGLVVASACSPQLEVTKGASDTGSLRPVVEYCEGKCDGPGQVWKSPYVADVEAMNQLWPGTYPMESVEDAFMVRVELGPTQFDAPTHLFGGPVNIIPYHDNDGVTDASGATLERGDQVIAEAFGPGTIGFVIKHHRPSHRVLNAQVLQQDIKEQAKLQVTHLGIVVGVEREGLPGAITLNNPQTYQGGRFGTPDYPMIFVKPEWPDYLDASTAQAFNDNTLVMMAGFNAVSNFPSDYNGGDPLGAHSVELLELYTSEMIRAIAGDAQAQSFFDDPATLLYCAELGFVGMSAGLHFPLNAATMVPRVGQEVWDEFVRQVELHNSGEASTFTTLNENTQLPHVRFTMPGAELAPMHTYSPQADSLATKLAFEPMTMADIVGQFLRTHVPREHLGEELAPVQGQLLASMKPGLLESMAMETIPADDPRRVAVDQLFDALVQVVSTSHGSYEEFQQALGPLMAQARQMTGPRDNTGVGYFVPPSLYHVVTQGKHQGGLIGLEYVGHGLHTSVVYDSGQTPEPSNDETEDPLLPADNPFAQSCTNSCGGQSPDLSCWCDTGCAEYGDCCDDIAQECGM